MDAWIAWLVAGCLLGLGELHTGGFFLAPFAAGALLAALAAGFGAGIAGSLVVFVVVSALTLAVLRPVARRHRRLPPALRTGTAALVGRPALVLERIVNDEGIGYVKIDGEVWTARSYDDAHVIEAGHSVEVVEIRGATALVME